MTINYIIYYINVFFFFYMFLYAILFFLTTILSSLNLDDFFVRKRHLSYSILKNEANYIPVSILVPAYNEEVTIIDTINSLLNLDYPEYEIVVINDGSTDKTAEVIIDNFNLKQVARPIKKLVESKDVEEVYENDEGVKIVLVNKENGGKSDALNMGVNVSRYPLFVCVDADSLLQYDSLKKIVEPFLENDHTIAVGFIAYPYFLFFEYITPILEVIGITTIVLSFILKIINTRFFIFYLLVYMGYNMVVSMIAVLLDKCLFGKDLPNKIFYKQFLYSIIESFGYRQLCSLYRLGAFNPFKKHEWGNMVRTKQQVIE
ncbi:MAG: glycosyltransferase family 2 protein [Tissierellia bacterium]|nr:glycosyltransferase family 2 protein [Tissierellia bacterium]